MGWRADQKHARFAEPLTLIPVNGELETTVQACLAGLSEVSRRKNVVLEYRCSAGVLDIRVDALRSDQAVDNQRCGSIFRIYMRMSNLG